MGELTGLGLLTAFGAGIVSFLSPCVLPLVPAYISYVAGQPLDQTAARKAARGRAAWLSACFVLGFSLVFIALGASATLIGRVLLQYRYEMGIVGGALVALFGVVMLVGVGRIPFLGRDFHFQVHTATGRPSSAFVLGLAFAFGWTPCIGPILGAILTVSAIGESVGAGVRLLAAYSAGLGIPFLLTGTFLNELAGRWRRLRRAGPPLQALAGVVMIVVGVAIMSGQLTVFSYWLLEMFPALGRIG
jgi:cytochrome c-type biogenesis protein